VLQDPQVARTSVYDTAGTFLRSWHSSCCYWSDIQIDRENRIYVPSMSGAKRGDPPRGIPYVRWSLDGTELDTVWVPRREPEKLWTVSLMQGGKPVSAMITSVPFMPEIAHALHPEGGIVYGWSGNYEIVYSKEGSDSARVFGRAWAPDPVTAERRMAEVESRIRANTGSWGEANVRSAFKVEDLPETLPAYENLRVDPAGRIWVRRWAVSDTTRTDFDVFDSAGAFLGPVTAPFKINPWSNQGWTREGLVTIIEDEEGRPTVVRLTLRTRDSGR